MEARPMAEQDVAVAQAEEVEEEFVAPERGSADELLDAGAHSELDAMRHSAAHVMAEAVLDLFPGTKFGIGPAIEDGFYYDFDVPRPLTPDDLERVEGRMQEHKEANESFQRNVVSRDEALAIFGDNPYKVELIEAFPSDEVISTYKQGDFLDLCRGPHVLSTAD